MSGGFEKHGPDQIQVARPIGCKRYRKALKRRSWIEVRFHQVHLPSPRERSDVPGL